MSKVTICIDHLQVKEIRKNKTEDPSVTVVLRGGYEVFVPVYPVVGTNQCAGIAQVFVADMDLSYNDRWERWDVQDKAIPKWIHVYAVGNEIKADILDHRPDIKLDVEFFDRQREKSAKSDWQKLVEKVMPNLETLAETTYRNNEYRIFRQGNDLTLVEIRPNGNTRRFRIADVTDFRMELVGLHKRDNYLTRRCKPILSWIDKKIKELNQKLGF